MKTKESPLSIPPDIAAKCDAPDQGENFDRAFRHVLTVSKSEIDRREREWKRQRKAKRAKKGTP